MLSSQSLLFIRVYGIKVPDVEPFTHLILRLKFDVWSKMRFNVRVCGHQSGKVIRKSNDRDGVGNKVDREYEITQGTNYYRLLLRG